MLTVLSRAHTNRRGVHWACQCDCGNAHVACTADINSGVSTSCGCAGKELRRAAVTRHGKYLSRSYKAWSMMLRRCRQPSCHAYGDYGGRGIAVCDEWLSFPRFYADMGDPPDGLQLERIDNDGNYEPANCK